MILMSQSFFLSTIDCYRPPCGCLGKWSLQHITETGNLSPCLRTVWVMDKFLPSSLPLLSIFWLGRSNVDMRTSWSNFGALTFVESSLDRQPPCGGSGKWIKIPDRNFSLLFLCSLIEFYSIKLHELVFPNSERMWKRWHRQNENKDGQVPWIKWTENRVR